MTNIDPQELVSRYVAVWNQPDSELRRKAIRALWTEDGAHILQPPEQIRKAAAGLGFSSTVLEARGHDALEVRVTRAYEEFVAPGGFTFRPRDNADRLCNVVKFNWDMVPSGRRRCGRRRTGDPHPRRGRAHQVRLSVHRGLTRRPPQPS